ncbi:MAG: glutaredoxin [Patescibacteria group bacterium]
MNIIVYTKRGCPWCEEVLELLQSKGVPFEEREVLSNEKYYQEMRDKSGQEKAPTLDVDGDILADTDADAVVAFLAEKGLPQFQS